MASKLVNQISNSVKKLIAVDSVSKMEVAHTDASVSTRIVSVREMLFGSPMKVESNMPMAVDSISNELVMKGKSGAVPNDVVALPSTEGQVQIDDGNVPAMVIIKKDPKDSNDASLHGAVANATEGAQDVLFIFPFVAVDNVEKATVCLPLCNTGDDFTCSS